MLLHRKRFFWPAVVITASPIGTVGILKGSATLVLLPIVAIILGGLALEYYEAISTERRQRQPNGIKRRPT
jgi:hypothetical protein